MTAREIPGFYFDEEKKKYFRIVNGDQRFNSNYQNNSIQSNNRERQNLSQSSNKRAKNGVDIEERSRNSQLLPVSLDLSRRFLLFKLNQDSICGLLQTRTEYALINSSLKPLISTRAWEGLNKDQVFICEHLSIKLYYVSDILNGAESTDLCLGIHHMSTGPSDRNTIVDLRHNGRFVFCQNGESCSLQEWSCYRGRFRIVDLTLNFKDSILRAYNDGGREISSPNRFVAQFFGKVLFLLSDDGYLILYDLNNRTVTSRVQIPFRRFENLYMYSSIHPYNRYIVFNLHKVVFVYDRKKGVFFKWNGPKHVIHGLFVEPITKTYLKSKTTLALRIRIVTSHAIMFVDFLTAGRFVNVLSPDIQLCQSNQAKPLIERLGDLLIVEESPKKLRVLNLKTNVIRVVTLVTPLLKERAERPRLFELNNMILMCDSHQTQAFQ